MVLVMVPPLLVALMLIARPAHARTRIEPGFEAALPDPPAPKPADGGILNLTSGYAALVEAPARTGSGIRW
jgi:flagellar L-ring protein precursor FlgH